LDDFVVPAGETWSLSSISVMGTWYGPDHLAKPTTFGITVFNRNHIMCRADVTVPVVETLASSSSSTSGVITVIDLPTPCFLVGGAMSPDVAGTLRNKFIPGDETYYLTVWPEVDFAHGGNSWYWSFSDTNNGDTFKFKDTETVWPNHECTKWTDASQCGLQLEGHTDLCFTISGRKGDSVSEDAYHLNKGVLPLRDSNIGTDVGHPRLLTSTEANQRLTASTDLAYFNQVNNLVSSATSPVYSPLSPKPPSEPSYVVPVAVTLAVIAALLLLGLVTWFVVFKQSGMVEVV